MNAHEFINKLKFDLNMPYIAIVKEIIRMLDEKDDTSDTMQIGDVVVNRVGLKDAESAIVTLKQ